LPSDLKDAIEGTLSSSAVNRGKAAKVLGELGERASPAVPFLIKLLSDDAKVGSIHLPANKEIPFRPGDVVPSQDVPVTVGDNAQEALERIGKPSVERCAAALKASSDTVRRYLIEVLGDIKDSRAIEPIGALLDDPNPWLRNQAVRAFLLWDDPRIIPHLIRALRDENYRVRQSAVWVMGTVHDPRLVQPLIDALKDKDESVRRGAVKALEEQRNPRGKKIP
jgi:HEAT repeat protein